MKRNDFRIRESELLQKEHFPVTAFFNGVHDLDFPFMLQQLSQEIGYVFNDIGCTFPGDLDPWEESFNGIMFSFIQEEVIIDYDTLLYYVKKASDVYVRAFPKEESLIQDYMNQIMQNANKQ